MNHIRSVNIEQMKLHLVLYFCVFAINNGLCAPKSTISSLETNIEIYKNQVLSPLDIEIVEKDQVTFKLWTELGKSVQIVAEELKDVKTNKGAPFKFLIHGYQSSANASWVHSITNSYLEKGTYNVVEVDWKKLAASWSYPKSAGCTPGVGHWTAFLISDLHKSLQVPPSSVHLIGHSLGAHISGFAGAFLKSMTSEKVGRITGLDPAGPLFTLADPEWRLDNEDAVFVDVIHTDGGKYGMIKSIGDVDFFPNGGTAPQPGCNSDIFFSICDRCVEAFKGEDEPNPVELIIYKVLCNLSAFVARISELSQDKITQEAKDKLTCSHSRAHELWIEGINSDKFIAHECNSFESYNGGQCNGNPIANMGEMVNRSAKGVFYLKTNGKPPFAKNGLM